MLPLKIIVNNEKHDFGAPLSPLNISLDDFLLKNSNQQPVQSSFNRYGRLPSLLLNITLWLVLFLTIAYLRIQKHDLTFSARILCSVLMLVIILSCYGFILLESKGCREQILLKNRFQVDVIRRALTMIEKNPRMSHYLSISATNYYNSLTGKYIDYRDYDDSFWRRLQSYFHRRTVMLECPLNIRSYRLFIPDFTIDSERLNLISYRFHLSIVGRDGDILRDDIEQEFRRLQIQLVDSLSNQENELETLNKFARIQRNILFRFNDPTENDWLLEQRRSCLTYHNRMTNRARWFLTENLFWIFTCIGLSWLFRMIFALFIHKIVIPIYIQYEGALPLTTTRHSDSTNRLEFPQTQMKTTSN